MVSDKKVKANRKNSLKSTGPKNVSKVKFNATKHGILSKEVFIPNEYVGEDKKDFEELSSSLIESLKPAGILEEMLVQKIIVSFWRLKRIYIAEQNSILDDVSDAERRAIKSMDSEMEYEHMFNKEFEPLPSRKMCIKLIEYYDGELEKIKNRESEDIELVKRFELKSSELDDVYAEAEKVIEARKEAVEDMKLIAEVMVEYKGNLAKKQNLVPNNFEILLRYETTIERQLYKALHELERLQNNRIGVASPTINIDF